MNHINKNTDLKNIIKVSINNNITMSLTMEQHKKKILKPTIIKYKGLDWLNKENTEKKFIKKKMLELKTSYNNIKKLISKNQNTIGFSVGGSGNSALVQKLQSYIDVNVKPQFIADYLNNNTDDLDEYILNNYTNVITNLNKYMSDSDTSYLASIGISILQLTSKGRTDFRILSEEVQRLDDRVRDLGGYLTVRQAPEVIRAVVEADVSIDVRYLLYIQTYGVPVGGVFDPDLLAEFDEYDN